MDFMVMSTCKEIEINSMITFLAAFALYDCYEICLMCKM